MEEYVLLFAQQNGTVASDLHLICACCVGRFFQSLACLQKLDKEEGVYSRVGCLTQTEHLLSHSSLVPWPLPFFALQLAFSIIITWSLLPYLCIIANWKKKTSENWEHGSVCDIKTPVEVDVHLDLHNWWYQIVGNIQYRDLEVRSVLTEEWSQAFTSKAKIISCHLL